MSGNQRQVAYAQQIVSFGIGEAQDVHIDIVSVTRGGVRGARTMILEYTLTSDSAAALDVAVENMSDKVTQGAVFQYNADAHEWPFVDNQVAYARVDGGQMDENALETHGESQGSEVKVWLMMIGVAVGVLLVVCGVAVCCVCRKRKGVKAVRFDHVDGDVEMAVGAVHRGVADTTGLVAEQA